MAIFKIDGKECVDPRAIRVEPLTPFSLGWFGKTNSMHLYRGKRPSECHLLVDKETLDTLNAATASHTVSISLNGTSNDLVTGFWTITHVEAIGQKDIPGQIFYIILKDPRHMISTVAKTPAQVIANTWEEELWPNNSTYTYQQVLQRYWDLMPAYNKANSITCPVLASTPASFAENIWCEGETVWECICRILAACGHVGVFDSVSGTYSFLQADATQAGLESAYNAATNSLLWDGDVPSGLNAGNAPASVGVSFRPSRTALSFRLPLSVDEYGSKQSIPTLLAGAKTGSVLSVTDTSRTKYCSETAIIKNQYQLTKRTEDLAKTIRGVVRSQMSKKIRVYDIVFPVRLGEEVTHVCFKSSRAYGFTTTVEHFEDFEILLPEPRNEQWDVSKLLVCKTTQTIPAMSGDTPGSGLAQVYGKPGSALAEIPYETVTINSIGAEAITSGSWVIVSMDFNSGQYFVVEKGVTAVQATTTTTTLVPPFPVACQGTCRWTSADGIAWTIDQNNCSNTTTSTTTSTTPAPGGSTTSSTTMSPCAITTTASPTTTTTAPGNCQCVPPTFCPIQEGDCTTTYCDRDFTNDGACTTSTTSSTTTSTTPIGGSTTTTTACNCNTTTTSTTTTPGPECSAGCEWCLLPNGTITVELRCDPSCPCTYPGGLSSICTCVTAPCVSTPSPPQPPPPPDVPCTGTCKWVCLGEGRGWWYDQFNSDCFLTGECRCSYPTDSDSCPCGATVTTPCVKPTTTTSTTTTLSPPNPCAICYTTTPAPTSSTTSTTTTADPCPGPCLYRWNAAASSWVLVLDKCGSCGCSSGPSTPGTGDCQVTGVACRYYTTTSSTTATPTTTTPIGACCMPMGGCSERSQASCTSVGGTYQGNGSTCAGVNYCASQNGACCIPVQNSCYEGVTQAFCQAAGHVFQGAGSTCAGVNCGPTTTVAPTTSSTTSTTSSTTSTTSSTTTSSTTTTTACPCACCYLDCSCPQALSSSPSCAPPQVWNCSTCSCGTTTTTSTTTSSTTTTSTTTGAPTSPPGPPP